MESRPKKLLDHVRDAIQVRHYARNTEQAYVYWIKKYNLFHHKRHPKEMGTDEVQTFLTQLALEEHISASTQNQALFPVPHCAESGAWPSRLGSRQAIPTRSHRAQPC